MVNDSFEGLSTRIAFVTVCFPLPHPAIMLRNLGLDWAAYDKVGKAIRPPHCSLRKKGW